MVFLKDLHHVCEIQNGTADTVEFVDNDPFDFSCANIIHHFFKAGTVGVLARKTSVRIFIQASPWVSYLQYSSWLSTDMLSFFSMDCLAYNASYIGIFSENLIEPRSDFLSGFLF